MHLKPYISENITSNSLIDNADIQLNNRQPRTLTSPSLLTLLFAASLLAKAASKSHYGYQPWPSYKPYSAYNVPYSYQYGHHQHPYATEYPPHHHHHQIHSPPVNQQQIVNIHERPHRPSGMGGGENFEDINEQNHQHIITTIQRPLNGIDEDVAASETHIAIALPETNFNLTESTTESTQSATETVEYLRIFSDKSAENAQEANVNYRRVRPESLYPKYAPKRTTYKPSRKYVTEPSRNRRPSSTKRVQRRPSSTFATYFDDYDEFNPTTQRSKGRKRTTPRRTYTRRRPSGPFYIYDEYDYENSLESTTRLNNRAPSRNKRKPVKTNHRRRPAEESPDSEYYSFEDGDDAYKDPEEYDGYADDTVELNPRQGTTSTTTETTTTDTTTQSSTTTTTEGTSSSTTTTPATSVTPTSSSTSSSTSTSTPTQPSNQQNNTQGYGYGYGYGPSGGNDNISITYGPPGHGGYGNYDYNNSPSAAGYGPSNGNDNISITYGPPTFQQRLDYVAPLLDAWYSQYSAKNAVVRRIQELLHQNSQPQPQADAYPNYNDNVY